MPPANHAVSDPADCDGRYGVGEPEPLARNQYHRAGLNRAVRLPLAVQADPVTGCHRPIDASYPDPLATRGRGDTTDYGLDTDDISLYRQLVVRKQFVLLHARHLRSRVDDEAGLGGQ
jgi:hypothetical protein